MVSFELVHPRTLEEAFDFLGARDPSVRPIGGGTALMLMMKAQLLQPQRLVSLRHLEAPFRGIELDERDSEFRIGAMTTFSELERSLEMHARLPVVRETMKTLANVRVRNVATVGGNLAHGDPHLDLPPVWIALGAQALVLSRSGSRQVAVEDIFADYYETTLEDGELIAEIRVPIRPEWRSTYVKVTTRANHDWPALGLAVSAEIAGARVNDCRVILSAAVNKPTRLFKAEAVLRGADLSSAVPQAAEAAAEEAEIEGDSRGSAAYKRHLLRIHLSRALAALSEA